MTETQTIQPVLTGAKVIRHKGFRYRIYPTKHQIKLLSEWEDALRFLWNLAHEQRIHYLNRPKCDRVYLSAFDQMKQLTELRHTEGFEWLDKVPRSVCSQLLLNLEEAWKRYFDKISDKPDWKRKGIDVIGITESSRKGWKLAGDWLQFPKLYRKNKPGRPRGYNKVKVVVHRPLEGAPSSCTIKRDTDQWFASIHTEVVVDAPTPVSVPVVAIDRGIINAAADSDGNIIKSPRFYEKTMRKLKRSQQSVSRKKKGSKNREKAKLKVAKVHQKVRRQREHFVHGLSHNYAKSHGVVILEDLALMKMIQSGSFFARGILDSGFGMLAKQLDYKLRWAGGILEKVQAEYSSQTCSQCGHIDPLSRNGEDFSCTKCGHKDHADVNAAKVLKSRWKPSTTACGEFLPKAPRRSRKAAFSYKVPSH